MKPHQVVVPLCIVAALSIASLAPASAAINPRDAHAPATGFPQVMLGYAGGKTVNFPDPWASSKHVTFIGATNGPKPKGPKGGPESGRWDTSGIELINPGHGALHVASVRVRFPVNHRKLSPWGAFDVTGGKPVILASTNSSHGGQLRRQRTPHSRRSLQRGGHHGRPEDPHHDE
jgi:hypothetical protein